QWAMLRLLYELKGISEGEFKVLSGRLADIGKQAQAWLKWCDKVVDYAVTEISSENLARLGICDDKTLGGRRLVLAGVDHLEKAVETCGQVGFKTDLGRACRFVQAAALISCQQIMKRGPLCVPRHSMGYSCCFLLSEFSSNTRHPHSLSSKFSSSEEDCDERGDWP
ncbi:MAG: hypothetical protein HYW49_01620, partial [Deltaproteobacteria bacterium]|nr:hypothetical protein [Deltaproteobacteria bacterium]